MCSIDVRWFVGNLTTGSGRGSPRCSRRSEVLGAMAETTESSSRPSCGGGGPECRGVTCRRNSGPGKPCSIGSIDGRRQGSGADFSRACRRTATMSGTASTARSTAPTSTRLEQKGTRSGGDWTFTRRPIHEGPSHRRRARPPADVRDYRGPTSRRSTREAARCSGHVAIPSRRQGL